MPRLAITETISIGEHLGRFFIMIDEHPTIPDNEQLCEQDFDNGLQSKIFISDFIL